MVPRYAAIDIGSNSLRMEAAEITPGQPAKILASDREVTRLGESVFRIGSVSEDAMRQTSAVLARMAALYKRLGVVGVRAVATSAIRDTRQQREFLERASEAAGARVDIISGREEARLFHLGGDSVWPQTGKRVLVIDIGGGSAEIIAAEDGRLREAFSRPLGAVRLSEMFLQRDPPTPRSLREMHEYVEEKLIGIVRRLSHEKWDRAIATSATAAAVASIVSRVQRSKRDEIDRLRIPTMKSAASTVPSPGRISPSRRKVSGIGPRRAEIIVPGVAVLLDFLEQFRLSSVYYSRAGVRDGIIADLAARNVGAELSRLSRDQRREVEDMARRFGVPLERARKVAHVAGLLFTALQPVNGLPPAAGKLLEAASYLHDAGHYISSASHHKHSYYIVANSDMPGFTERERLLIASLCRYHRKSLPSPLHSALQALTAEERRTLNQLIPLLRLADNLDRGHDHRINAIKALSHDPEIVLEVHADGAIEFEQWRAERAGEPFRQIYGRPLRLALN